MKNKNSEIQKIHIHEKFLSDCANDIIGMFPKYIRNLTEGKNEETKRMKPVGSSRECDVLSF